LHLLHEPAKSIAMLGFRRWYERQLIESHAYLVTGFLCLIAVLACVEEFNIRAPGLVPVLMLALIAGVLLIGIFACWRYLATLAYAEHLAESSTCAACTAYAAYIVLSSGWNDDFSSAGIASPGSLRFAVKCRKCGHQWTIC